MADQQSGAQDLLSLAQTGQILFGGAQSSVTSGTTVQKEKLNISQEAISKIIQDVLSGAEGLASIFAGEQTAGIFDSSVAAQAAGDLASKLAGDIAKLTAEKEITVDTTSETEEESEGLLKSIGGALGL